MLFHRRIRFLLSSALLPAHLRSAVPLPVLPGLRSAFQIRNIRLHQFGLTRSTNARDDLDVRSTIQFNDSVEILCSCNRFHIVTRFQKSKIFIFLKLLRCTYYTVC